MSGDMGKNLPESFGVFSSDAEDAFEKHGFVAAHGMLSRKAVFSELAGIDERSVGIRNAHARRRALATRAPP